MKESLVLIFGAIATTGVLVGWVGSILNKTGTERAWKAVQDEKWRAFYEWAKGVDSFIGSVRKSGDG